jgi:hypothetical protein
MVTVTRGILLNMAVFLVMSLPALGTLEPHPLFAAFLTCLVCDVLVYLAYGRPDTTPGPSEQL